MTVNRQVLEGSWDQVKGKVRERWGQITENELEEAKGNTDQLIGVIQEKTGEARGEVESFLEDTACAAAGLAHRAKETAAQQVQATTETAQQAAERAVDSARAGYIQAGRTVRRRPMESLAVCFGAGLITGVVVGLLVRGK